MGFLTYSLRYYRDALQTLEDMPAAPDRIDHARQLLRMLDDLTDEGYTELNAALEETFCGVTRLRTYLQKNHAAPFSFPAKPFDENALAYSSQNQKLGGAIERAMQMARAASESVSIPFADKLRRFCDWIGCEDGTAYIFLLRDALLPYVYYAARDRKRIYPWLLGRKSFAALTGQPNADDAIRSSIYGALEAGCADFQSFCQCALPDIRRTMRQYPQAESALRAMLESVDADKIIIVESGCAGTFPLLLMSLDDRADMRMYTTYPYLNGIYTERVFTSRYEENRMFETMAAQDAYFRFSELRDGRFYVQKCANASVEIRALSEIGAMLTEKNDQ